MPSPREVPKRLKPTIDTLRRLFAVSGNLCAFPKCNAIMIDDHGDLVGEVCHIKAAEPGGERFDSLSTNEQRRAFDNLMLLCGKHHVKTNKISDYPVETLIEMKREHELHFTAPERVLSNSFVSEVHIAEPIRELETWDPKYQVFAFTGKVIKVVPHGALIGNGFVRLLFLAPILANSQWKLLTMELFGVAQDSALPGLKHHKLDFLIASPEFPIDPDEYVSVVLAFRENEQREQGQQTQADVHRTEFPVAIINYSRKLDSSLIESRWTEIYPRASVFGDCVLLSVLIAIGLMKYVPHGIYYGFALVIVVIVGWMVNSKSHPQPSRGKVTQHVVGLIQQLKVTERQRGFDQLHCTSRGSASVAPTPQHPEGKTRCP